MPPAALRNLLQGRKLPAELVHLGPLVAHLGPQGVDLCCGGRRWGLAQAVRLRPAAAAPAKGPAWSAAGAPQWVAMASSICAGVRRVPLLGP